MEILKRKRDDRRRREEKELLGRKDDADEVRALASRLEEQEKQMNVCGLLDIKVAFASSVGMHERVKHGGLQCDGCDFTYKRGDCMKGLVEPVHVEIRLE